MGNKRIDWEREREIEKETLKGKNEIKINNKNSSISYRIIPGTFFRVSLCVDLNENLTIIIIIRNYVQVWIFAWVFVCMCVRVYLLVL